MNRPLALLIVLAGCYDDEAGNVLRDVTVEPSGAVSACSPLTLRVELAGLARYSIVADGTLLAAGLLYAGSQTITLPPLPAPADGGDATRLTVTAVGSSAKTERRELRISRSGNSAPRANAGPTRRTLAGQPVVLDGSGSRDPDGDPLTYAWSILDGAAQLEGSDQTSATVTVQDAGYAEIELVVTDPSGATGRTRVTVRATDAGGPPVFIETSDTVVLTAEPGDVVEIDATASSPGDAAVRYRYLQTAGPATEITQTGPTATVRAPSSEGLVTIEAIADNGYADVRKRVSVLVGSDTLEDSPPTPVISAPPSAPIFSEVVLDGSGSSDSERSDLTYLWSVEHAPEGSRLSAATIRGNGTSAAARPTVLLDHEGRYVFRLRAVDAVGPSPRAAEVVVEATADVEIVDTGAIRDLAVDPDGHVLASLTEGGVVFVGAVGEDVIDDATAMAVAYSPIEDVFYYARSNGPGPAEIVAVSPTTGAEIATQVLPADGGEDPPSEVRGIAVSPEGPNEGDLFVATNAGFIILDVSEVTKEDPLGRPQAIGGDFVHRPPSFNPGEDSPLCAGLDAAACAAAQEEFAAAQLERGGELAAIGARVGAADAIEVVSGNPFWVVSMDYPENKSFVTRTYDPLADEVPNAVLALGVGPDSEIIMLEGLGVFWRGGDDGADCLLSPSADPAVVHCGAPVADACAELPSESRPADMLDAVASSSGRFWIASSDGVRRLDSTTGTFARLSSPGPGPARAIGVSEGVVVVGTDNGLVIADVGSGE